MSKLSKSSVVLSSKQSGSSAVSEIESSERMPKKKKNSSFTFKRKDSGNDQGTDGISQQNLDDKKVVFPWPDTLAKRIFFIIFFPTHIILWLCFPDTKRNPQMSKIILTCIYTVFVSLMMIYGIVRLEVYIGTALNLKTHIIGLFNGVMFGVM